MRRRQGGFSLLELAVVLTVIGLVLGAMTPFMASLIRNARAGSQRETMALMGEMLADHAARHAGCLPFAAAMDGDFRGETAGGSGISDDAKRLLAGEFPWRTLGMTRPRDAATQPFRYIVAPALAGADCPGAGWSAAGYGDGGSRFPAIHAGPDADSEVVAERAAFVILAPGSDNALDAGHRLAGADSGGYVLVRASGADGGNADSLRAMTPAELRVTARRFAGAAE